MAGPETTKGTGQDEAAAADKAAAEVTTTPAGIPDTGAGNDATDSSVSTDDTGSADTEDKGAAETPDTAETADGSTDASAAPGDAGNTGNNTKTRSARRTRRPRKAKKAAKADSGADQADKTEPENRAGETTAADETDKTAEVAAAEVTETPEVTGTPDGAKVTDEADAAAEPEEPGKAEEVAAVTAESEESEESEEKAAAEPEKAEGKADEAATTASLDSVSEAAPAPADDADEGDVPLMRVKDLQVHLDTPRGVLKAVDGVSFTIRRGGTLGLVGESGSGKSMLVRSLMGISPGIATIRGSVQLDGQELIDLPRKEARKIWGNRIAMVFQDPMTSLNPVVRIERQLTESMRLHLKLSKAEAKERAVDMLKLVGIPEPLKRSRQFPHQLSGGMRQRVTIAMALGCDPDLLIADEATTALDVTVQRQILDLLQEIQAERGMGMILVSHDLGVVAGRTDQIAVMYAGRMVEHAQTNELFATRRHRYTEALLGAVPRLDVPKTQRPRPIPGAPPDLITLKSGCAFAARCSSADDLCRDERPELRADGEIEHRYACHHPVGGDLVGAGAADAPTLTKEVSA